MVSLGCLSWKSGGELAWCEQALAVGAFSWPSKSLRQCSPHVGARRASSPSGSVCASTSPQEGGNQAAEVSKRVVVLGGSGRVGRSTAIALSQSAPQGGAGLQLVIAGRNRERGEEACASSGGATFQFCDIDRPDSLRAVLEGADLVVHTAGPFQRRVRCTVLEAAIDVKVPYLDVCDDMEYSKMAHGFGAQAAAAGVPAITTGGIYPGISNLMAAELVRLCADSGDAPERLRFSYFTAGSGGAGPTILATSYLLLGEEALTYQEGKEVYLRPWSARRTVDFGRGIGKRDCFLLNLPEVHSAHTVLKVPSVNARFGTAPGLWNLAMEAVVSFLSPEFLRDDAKVKQLVAWSNPWVRAVDGLAGERVGMRVDLDCASGKKASALYTHKRLSECVGQCAAAFALAMLEGATRPGVWFPEEAGALGEEARAKVLERAARNTITMAINKSPWMLDTPPKEIGFGLYL